MQAFVQYVCDTAGDGQGARVRIRRGMQNRMQKSVNVVQTLVGMLSVFCCPEQR